MHWPRLYVYVCLAHFYKEITPVHVTLAYIYLRVLHNAVVIVIHYKHIYTSERVFC